MQTIVLNILKIPLIITYFFLKLLPTSNKVVLISRFFKTTSIDFELLIKEINTTYPNYKIVVLNHKETSPLKSVNNILIEMYHLATSKAAIIDSYIIPISVLTHKKELVIIQIWHALGAIKKFGYASIDTTKGHSNQVAKALKMHYNYTYLISSSEATSNYFQVAFNIDKERILPIGLPRIEYLSNKKQQRIFKEIFYNQYPSLKDKKIILYAPTFRKNETICVDDLVDSLPPEIVMIVKSHPLDKTEYLNYPNVLIEKKFNSLDLLFISDYLITDYSAISFEAAVLNLPIYFYIYDFQNYQKSPGLFMDLKKLYPSLSFNKGKYLFKILINDKYDKKAYEHFRKTYLPKNKNITQEIVKLIERKSNE